MKMKHKTFWIIKASTYYYMIILNTNSYHNHKNLKNIMQSFTFGFHIYLS